MAAACPGVTYENGPTRTRALRCQGDPGHGDQCYYYRKSSQGGTTISWWDVNPRPAGFLGDLGFSDLVAEVSRLRDLCERFGIDWKAGLS